MKFEQLVCAIPAGSYRFRTTTTSCRCKVLLILLISFLCVPLLTVHAGTNLKARKVLVVAGNFSIDGQLVNIAQYDIGKKEWSTKYEAELYLYGESNGIIWDLAVNKTSQPYSKLFVVGAFDTVSETSQIQFCSVGEWDGDTFDKVGEGLCPRGGDSSTAMSIQTAALGNDGDIFVGGSFESRVWDGHHFVNVYHVAHYDGIKSSWLPLLGVQLQSDDDGQMPRVNTLAWDAVASTLYVGGTFYAGGEGGHSSSPLVVDDVAATTPGLAVWSESTGLQPFPGGGLYRDRTGGGSSGIGASGDAFRIAFEPQSMSLFVAGVFNYAGADSSSLTECQNIIVWQRKKNEWRCLYQADRSFSSVTSLLVYGSKVYVSGWASSSSDWNGRTWGSPYAIAVMDIAKYIEESQVGNNANNTTPASGATNSTLPGGASDVRNGSSVNGNGTGVISSKLAPGTAISHILQNGSATRVGYRRRKTARLTEQVYAAYSEEVDLTKASSLEEVLEIFRRSVSSSYRTVANTADTSGDSAWPSVFAMKRRIRRRLLRSQGDHHDKHDNVPALRDTKRPASISPRGQHHHQQRGRRRLQQSDTLVPLHAPTPVLPQANNVSGNDSASVWAPSMAPQYVSRAPTAAPVVTPWRPLWTWLSGYSGGNGPILRIVPGSETFDGYLFIVGAFNNYPAIAIWADDPDVGPFTAALPSKHSVQGFITSIAQVNLPPEATDPSQSGTFGQKDYTLLILLACVMVGIVLGVAFAIGCHSGGYIKVVGGDEEDEEGVGGEEVMGIPLKTLSGGANYNVDFRECFERAMKARHLPTHESLLVINPKEIMLSKIIGEGSFGRVWNGQWRNNSVAVKEFVFAQAAIVGGSLERNNIIEEIVGEAGVMACLRHPKILQLYGCSLTMQAIWIVSEFCSRGSLRMILNDRALDLPFLKKVSICLDVADGMLYLHTRQPPIIHRDIKSHNIFITEPSPGHFVAKIGDWGSARAVALTGAKSMTQGVGTACWLAPEVINFAHSSKDSDVYAFGIVLWEVFTRAEVYEGLSAAQIIAKVANEGLRPKVPRDCPWASIMTECWHQDASQRPGFHRVMTSLSKIYSRAKAASKGRASATSMSDVGNTTPSKPKSNSESGSGSGSGLGPGSGSGSGHAGGGGAAESGGAQAEPSTSLRQGERTPLLDFRSRANSETHSVHSSISGTSTRPSGYQYSSSAGDRSGGGGGGMDDIPAPAGSAGAHHTGIRSSYFQSSPGTGASGYERHSLGRTSVGIPGDQYLTAKQKMPCRISSDPTKTTSLMLGQEGATGAGVGAGHALGASQPSKAKSSDLVLSMFSAISESQAASSATAAAALSSTDAKDTPRLYEFTAISSPVPSSSKEGKKVSRHSSPGTTDPVTSSAGDHSAAGGGPGDLKKGGKSLALKSVGSHSPQGSRDGGGLIAVRKARSTRSVFKAEVDVGDGRLSPVEYVILEGLGKEHSLDGSLNGASIHGSSDESAAESGKGAAAAKPANASLPLSRAHSNSDESLGSPGVSPQLSAVPARRPSATAKVDTGLGSVAAAAGTGTGTGTGVSGAGGAAVVEITVGVGSAGTGAERISDKPTSSSTTGTAPASATTIPQSSGKKSDTSFDKAPVTAGTKERHGADRSHVSRPESAAASPGIGPMVPPRDRDFPASPLPPPNLSSASEEPPSSSGPPSGPPSGSPSRGEESRSSSRRRGANRPTRSRSTSRGRLPQELLAAAAAVGVAAAGSASDKVGQKGGRGPEDGNERDDEAGDSDDDGTGYGTP